MRLPSLPRLSMSERQGQALGILGGTFDPIHSGHLRLAEEALTALELAGILWVPAGQPYHRDAPHARAAHRLAMVHLAVAGHPGFAVDASEVLADTPSYSVPMLERLRKSQSPDRSLVLLLGVDAFLGLSTWHRWRDLFALAHIAVATRPGHALVAEAMPEALAAEFATRCCDDPATLAATPGGRILPFTITALDISATDIRAQFAAGRSPRYLLPEAVLDYIADNKLYAD
jgi:nicotinate-nucleotide adenylyltransferase